ncbi:uncharacterized protein [Asterias amurensis]|uniref:uncharacterized protein n=1 Tax=Asterias amurensis TaxID=7602 RepID=UPI003AB1A993
MHSRKRWAGDEPFGSKWSSGLRESPPKLPAHGKWWKCLTDLPSRNQKWGGQGVRFGILPGRELDHVHVKTLEEIRQEKELKKRRAEGIPSTDTRPTVSTLQVRDPSCSINQAKTPSHLPRPCSLKTHQHMDAKNKERAVSVLNKYLKDGIYENNPQVSKITDLRSRLSLGVKFVADTTDRNHCGQVRETYVQNMRRREPIDGKTFSKGSRAWSGGYLKLQTASRTHLGVGKPDEDQYAGKAQEADEDDACSTSDVSDEEDTDDSSDDASDGEVQIRNVEQEIERDSEDDETSDGSSEDELDSSESELRESDDEVCNAHRADSEIQSGASNEQTAHSEPEENGEVDDDLGRDESINDLISEEEFESLESDHELCSTEAIELERVTGRGDGLVEVTSRQDKRQVEEGSEDRVFTADVHEESSDVCDSVSNDEVCGASADEVAPDFEPEEKQIKDLQGKESTDENEDTEVGGEFSVEDTDGEPNCCLEDKSLFSKKIAAVDDMPLDKENQDEQIQNLHGQESRKDKEDIEDGGKFSVGDSDGEPNCSVENTSEEDSSFSGTFVDEVQPDKENEGEQMEDIQGGESGEGSEDGGKRPVGDSDRVLNGCEEDPSEKEQSFSGLSAAVDEMQFDKENKNEQMQDLQGQERGQDKEDIEDDGNLLVEDSDRKSSSHEENQSEEEPSFPGTSTAVDGVLLDKENQESGEDSEDVEDGGKLPVEDYDGELSCCKENHSEEEPSFSRIAVDEMQQNKENKYEQLEVDIYGDKQGNESLFSVIDRELFIHEEYDTNVLCEADEQLEMERELAGIIDREAMEERRREEREALVTVIIEVFDKDDGHKMDTNLPANRTSRPCLDFETMEQSEGGPTDDKGITKIGKEAGNILDYDILSDEGSSEKPKLPQARKTDSRPRGDTVVDVTKERDCEDENTTTGSKDEEARQIEEINDGALLICEAILPQEDNRENVVSEFDGGKETRDQHKEKHQMGSDSIVGQGYDEPSHDNLEKYERQLVCIIDKVKSAEMDLCKKGRPIKDSNWEKDDLKQDKDEEAVKGGTEDGSSYEQKAQKDIHLCNDGDGQIKTDGTPEDGQKKDENIWEDGEVRDDYAELGFEDVTEEGTAFDKDCLQELEQGTVVEDHEDISIAADDVANNKQGSTEEQEEEVPDSEIMETDEDISENDTSSSGVCDKEIVEETILRGWEENDREVKGDKLDEGRKSEDEELPEDDMKEIDKDDRDRCAEMKNKSKEGKNNGAKKDAQNVQAVTREVYPVGQDIGTHMDCQIGLETNKKSLDSQAEVINMDMCCQHQELDGYSTTKETMVDDTKKHTDDSAATDEPSVNHRQTRVGRNKRRLVHQGVGKGQEVADKEVACDMRGSLEKDAVNIAEQQVMEDDVVGKRKVGQPRTRPETQKRGTTLSRTKRATTLGRSVVMSSLRMEGDDAVVKRKRSRPHKLRETSMEINRQNLEPGVVIQDFGVTEEKPEAVHPKQPKLTRRKARQRMMSIDGWSKELGQGHAIQLILEQGEVLKSGRRPSPVVEVDVRLGNDRESHSVVSPVSKKRMTQASLKPRCCRRLRDRDDVMVKRKRGRPCSPPAGIEKDETLRATLRASTEEKLLSPVDTMKLTASSLPQAEGKSDKVTQPVLHQDDSQQESTTQKQCRRQLDNNFDDHKDQECLIPRIVTTQSSCSLLPQTEGNTEEDNEVQQVIQGRAQGNESTECSQGLDTSRAVKTRGRKPLTPNMPAFLGPTMGDEAKTVNDAKMQVTLSKTLEPKALLSCVSGDDTTKPSCNRRRKAKIREASSDLSSGQSEDQSDKDNTSKSTSRSISAALTSPFRTQLRKRSQLQGLPTPEVEAKTNVHTVQMQQMSASQSQPKADSPSNETVIYQESFKNAIIQEMASFYPIINLTPLHVPEAYLIADASRRVSANECGITERGTSSTWLKGSLMPETEDEVNSENTEAQPPEVVSCTSAAKLDSTANKHQKWLDAIVGVDCSLSTGIDGYCKVDSEIHLRLPENLSKEMCTEEDPIARKRRLVRQFRKKPSKTISAESLFTPPEGRSISNDAEDQEQTPVDTSSSSPSRCVEGVRKMNQSPVTIELNSANSMIEIAVAKDSCTDAQKLPPLNTLGSTSCKPGCDTKTTMLTRGRSASIPTLTQPEANSNDIEVQKLTAGSTQQSESRRQEPRPVRGRAKGAMNLGVLPEDPPPEDPRPALIEDNGIVNPSAQSAPSAISSKILPSTCDAAGKKMRTVGRLRKKLQDLVSSEPSSKQTEENCYKENLKISSESVPEIDPEPNVRKARVTRKWRTRPSEANTKYPLLKQTEADGSKTKDTGIKLPAPDPVQSNPPKRRIKLKRGIKPPEVAKDDYGTTHPVPISNLNTSQSEPTKLGSLDDTVKRGECSVTPDMNETFMQQIPPTDASESSSNIFDLIMKRQVQVSLPMQAEVNVTGTETEAHLIPLENALQSERSKTAKEIVSCLSSTSSKPSTQSDENDSEKSAKIQTQTAKNMEQADSNHCDAIGKKLRTTKQRGKMPQQINSFGSLSTQSELKESDKDIEVSQHTPEKAVQSTQSHCVDIGKKRGRKAKKNRMKPPEIVFFGASSLSEGNCSEKSAEVQRQTPENKLHSDPSLCEAIVNKSRKRKRIAAQRFASSDSSTQSVGIDRGKSKEVHQEASENASKSAQRNAKRRRKQPPELDSSEPSWTQFEGDDNNQSVEVHHQVCNDASITSPGRCDAIVQEAQAVITRSRNIARDDSSDPTKQSGENYTGKDVDVQNEAITKHSAPTRNKSRIEERQAGRKRRETISEEALLSSEAGEDHTEKDSKLHKLPPRDTSKSVHKQCDLVVKKPRGLRKRRRKPISKETVSTDYSSSTQDKGEENTNFDAVVDESRSAVVFRSNTPKRISPEACVFNGEAQSQENTILEESISKDEINSLHLMKVQESKESSVHGHEGDTNEDEVCETLPKVKRRKTNDGGQNNAISKLKRKPFKKRFSTSPPEKPRMCSEGDRATGPSGDAQVSKLRQGSEVKGLKSSSDACGDAATTGSTVPQVDGSEQYIWSRILGKVSLSEILTNQPTVRLSRLKFRETVVSEKFSSPRKRPVKHGWTRRRKVMSIATIARRMTKGLEAIQETWNRLGFQIPSELTSATMDRTLDGCHRSTLPKRSLDGERRSVSEGRIKYSSGTPNSAPPIEIVEAPEVAHTVEVVSIDDLPVTPRYEGCFVPRALQGSGKSNIRPSAKISSCGLEVKTSTADSASAVDIDSELENQVSILLSEYESMEVASSTVEMSSSEDICGSDTFFIASPSVRVVSTPVDMMPSFNSRQSTLDMLRTLPRTPVTDGEARARCTPIFTGCSDDVVSSRSMWRASRSTDTTSDDDRLDSKSQGYAFMEGSNGSFLLNQERKCDGPSPPSSQEPLVDWQAFSLSTEQHVGGQTHLFSPEQVDGQASSLQQTGGQSGLICHEEVIRGHNDSQTPLLSLEQLGDGQMPLLSPERQVGGQIPLLSQEQQFDDQAPLLSPEQQVDGQSPLLSQEQQVGGQTPLLSPEQQVDGQSPLLSPEQQVGGQSPLLSPEQQVDGQTHLLSPEQQVGGQTPLLSPEQQVGGQTPLLSPEQHVGGQTPLLSPEQQFDGPSPLLSPEQHVGGQTALLSPEQQVGGQTPLLSPEQQFDGPSPLLSPEQHVGGQTALLSPEQQVGGQTPLLSPEQQVGGQTPLLSPEQQVGGQTPLLSPEQQVGGQTPLLSPEQQVGGQTPSLSPDQQVCGQTPLLIQEQLNGCQDHVLSPAQQADGQVHLLNPTQQVDGQSPFLNPEQRINGQDLLMNQELVSSGQAPDQTAKQALSNALDKESKRLAPSQLESKSEEILPVKNSSSAPASCETASKGSTPPSSQTALSMPDLGREVLQQYHAGSPPFQQISESPKPVDPAAANYEEDPQDLSIGLADIILSPLVDSFEFPEEDCLSLLCDSPGFLDDIGDELLEIDKQMGQSEKRQAGGSSSRHTNPRQGTNNADSDSVRPINGNASLQTVDWSEVSQYQPINSLTGGDCSISSAGRVNRNNEGKIVGINQPQAAPWTGLALANQASGCFILH